MTELQEIYDRVKKHLLCQMKQSRFGVACKYRGPDGLKCAVGILIPDEDYDPTWDTRLGGLKASMIPVLEHVDAGFLDALQFLHDNYGPDCWEKELKSLAKDYNLHD